MNKKSGNQVWYIQKSDRAGYFTLVNPQTQMALDNGNNGTQPGEVCPWDVNPGNANQQWKLTHVEGDTYTFTSAAGGFLIR